MTAFAPTISSNDLHVLIEDLHHSPEDFIEGDIAERLEQYATYTLMSVPVNSLNFNDYNTAPCIIIDYARDWNDAVPPVVFDPINDTLIDGAHRAAAAAQRGLAYIQAYVGDKDTYTPLPEEDDNEEDDEDNEDDDDA